jgi:hypothetical protein
VRADTPAPEDEMSAPKGTRPRQGQLTARSSTYLTALEGPEILAYGASELRFTGLLRNIRDSFSIKPRYRRIAVVADNPENAAWNDGTAISTEVNFCQDMDLSSLGSYMFVQVALGAAATSGSGGEGLAMFQAWVDTTAEIVVRQTVTLQPVLNTSQVGIIPLGKPFPAFGLTGVMIAVAARGVTGSPTMNFLTRTFSGDPTRPGAWDTGSPLLGSNKTFSTTNEDYNSGNLAFAPTDVAYAQLAAKIPDVNATGTFDIIIAAKY